MQNLIRLELLVPGTNRCKILLCNFFILVLLFWLTEHFGVVNVSGQLQQDGNGPASEDEVV